MGNKGIDKLIGSVSLQEEVDIPDKIINVILIGFI
jgi:hypothetical protein